MTGYQFLSRLSHPAPKIGSRAHGKIHATPWIALRAADGGCSLFAAVDDRGLIAFKTDLEDGLLSFARSAALDCYNEIGNEDSGDILRYLLGDKAAVHSARTTALYKTRDHGLYGNGTRVTHMAWQAVRAATNEDIPAYAAATAPECAARVCSAAVYDRGDAFAKSVYEAVMDRYAARFDAAISGIMETES